MVTRDIAMPRSWCLAQWGAGKKARILPLPHSQLVPPSGQTQSKPTRKRAWIMQPKKISLLGAENTAGKGANSLDGGGEKWRIIHVKRKM